MESSGEDVKRNVIPTEVFEEGMAGYDIFKQLFLRDAVLKRLPSIAASETTEFALVSGTKYIV